MELRVEELEKLSIIHVTGEFYIGNIKKFEEIWNTQVEKKPATIAINCSKLEFIDSSAIGTLVKFLNGAMNHNIKLLFYDLSPAIQNIFKTARLDSFFTIITKSAFEAEYLK